MKRLLIISPYFSPVDAADMQRVRMSLPYFEEMGWQPEVVTVDPVYTDMVQDNLLSEAIPATVKIHRIKALNKTWTAKVGLGSIALRSLWSYQQKVNELLSQQSYDLIYFSTTQFPVCILGAYWKKRFGIPYVIDIQDPWHTDFYLGKPKHERPPKYWFSYRLNKYTEAIAMKAVNGLISVSEKYIDDLKDRYPHLKYSPSRIITFGAFEPDLVTAITHQHEFTQLLDRQFKNIVYVGRGGTDMHRALNVVFSAMKQGLDEQPELFSRLHFNFIGTSYAPDGQGKPTILPLAESFGLAQYVIERTERVSFYHALNLLMASDALLVLGSDSPGYTASKLYPYLLTGKPLLAILNTEGPAADTLKEFSAENVTSYNSSSDSIDKTVKFLTQAASGQLPKPVYNSTAVQKYSASNMAQQQVDLFNEIAIKV